MPLRLKTCVAVRPDYERWIVLARNAERIGRELLGRLRVADIRVRGVNIRFRPFLTVELSRQGSHSHLLK
ncbi:MAG TPA: hypothetical protein DEQ40_10420 [Oxalobacteraceae bacterium]|nr:hypothetical protein [Oxalobacteraceae bacterium]